jgi:hypothetical protein
MWFALTLSEIRSSNTISRLIIINFFAWPHGVRTLYRQVITTCVTGLNVEHCLSFTYICHADIMHFLWVRNLFFMSLQINFFSSRVCLLAILFRSFATVPCYLNHIIIFIIMKGTKFVPVTILTVERFLLQYHNRWGYYQACSRPLGRAKAACTDCKCKLESL